MAVSFQTLAFLMVGAGGLTLAITGPPGSHNGSPVTVQADATPKASSAKAPAPPAPPPSATAAGMSLRSVDVSLPTGDRGFPDGPHADVMSNNCLSCHSAGMVLNQPSLTRAEWQGEVTKMRNVYKAPVDEADASAIVDYLASIKGR